MDQSKTKENAVSNPPTARPTTSPFWFFVILGGLAILIFVIDYLKSR